MHFERLCLALWKSMDSKRSWDLNGRPGQRQHGIDLFGRKSQSRPIGIECKARDRFLGSMVTPALIDEIVKRVIAGKHALESLIIASTSPSDTAISQRVDELSKQCQERHDFGIEYWSWDRICEELSKEDHEQVRVEHLGIGGLTSTSETRRRIGDYCVGLYQSLNKLTSLAHLREDDRVTEDPDLASIYTMLRVRQQVTASGPPAARDLLPPDAAEDTRGDVTSLALGHRGSWTLGCDPLEADALVLRLAEEASVRGIDNGDYVRAATLLEAAAVSPNLLLTGYGGSGKSTFLRYVCLCLAGETMRVDQLGAPASNLSALADGDDPVWGHGRLLPLWVEARSFADWDGFPRTKQEAKANDLWKYLEARRNDSISDALRGDLQRVMDRGHVIPSVLLALDGLDELPDPKTQLEPLLEVVANWLKYHPRCRVVLTSRPYAVDSDRTLAWLRSHDFQRAELASLNDEDNDAFLPSFLRVWFEVTGRPVAEAEAFIDALDDQRPRLREIIDSPLMATLVAEMFDSQLHDWNSSADVFEAAVVRLVDRWNQGRGIVGAKKLSDHEASIRLALEELAWGIQAETSAEADSPAARIQRHELVEALQRHGVPAEDVRGVPKYLKDRCGILECSGDEFHFPHRKLREFLVATHAARHLDHPLPLLEATRERPGHWREVLLLAGARGGAKARHVPAWTLLDYAIQEDPPQGLKAEDPRFELVEMGSQLVVENDLDCDKEWPANHLKLERLRKWIEACLKTGALPTADRARVGRHLAQLGDRRPGVGLDHAGRPDIDWVEVDVGDGRRLDVARYPITNAQYDAFTEAGGYTNDEWRSCWSEAGRAWLDKSGMRVLETDLRSVLLLANHPRVAVCLHEASAYTNWLSKLLGRDISLLSEGDWEAVTRGKQGRTYAWGDDYDPDRCNGEDADLHSTCAVGMFPRGATPEGVHGLTGNVWEWTWRNGVGTGEPQGALRGGAWHNVADYLRADFRVDFLPESRYGLVGFRVCAPASRP